MSTDNLQIRVTDWETDNKQISVIRRQVFIDEQNVPEEMEWDEYDSSSTHFIATIDDRAIATSRLKPDGQIGRMAVLAGYRNQGIGGKLLQFVLLCATEKNMGKLYLHAQVSAIAFYEKHGFSTRGEVFYEANIPHREMLKIICQGTMPNENKYESC
ncbi:MAG TPA: GNAT family N-acetyltransferase [Gammaproteobacteria bacterium]|nr:GNAT family N-acetyltransferase [Gammaproteobacteria bacterium]